MTPRFQIISDISARKIPYNVFTIQSVEQRLPFTRYRVKGFS
jgi:hypothetical protein